MFVMFYDFTRSWNLLWEITVTNGTKEWIVQKSWVAHRVRYADSLPKGFAERIARELEETLFQHGPLTYGILCLQDCPSNSNFGSKRLQGKIASIFLSTGFLVVLGW